MKKRLARLWPAYLVATLLYVHGVHMAGLTAVPLVAIAVLAEDGARLAVPRALTWLGDISYSLNLVHPIVQEGWDHATGGWSLGPAFGGFDRLALTTGASIAAAAVSHRSLEGAASEWLQRWWGVSNRR